MSIYTKKKTYIAELGPDQPLADLFVLAGANKANARNGQPFWALTLADRTGRMDAKIFAPASLDYPHLAPGMIARVEGRTQLFQGKVSAIVERLTMVDPTAESLDMAQFVPASAVPPRELYGRLMDLCVKHLAHPAWIGFVRSLLEDPEIKARLLAAPGAKNVHHAYMGGLLEHTLSVAGLCMRFCDHYPELDRQVLLAACVVHDLGKAWELSGGLANDYTDEGRLIGHISLCIEIIAPYLAQSALDRDLVLHLKHIILSHHGEYAFGSPRRPKTMEAMALHYADNLDAKMNQVSGVFADMARQVENGAENGAANGEAGAPDEDGAGSGVEGVWSSYQRTLERYLFNPRRTPKTPETTERAAPRAAVTTDAADADAEQAEPEPEPAAVAAENPAPERAEEAAAQAEPGAKAPEADAAPEPALPEPPDYVAAMDAVPATAVAAHFGAEGPPSFDEEPPLPEEPPAAPEAADDTPAAWREYEAMAHRAGNEDPNDAHTRRKPSKEEQCSLLSRG